MSSHSPVQQHSPLQDPYSHLRNAAALVGEGILVIKASCAGEYRRIPILNRELTYDELCLMIHRLFRNKLSANTDNLVLQYKDNEGDWISLTDDLDINHAVQLAPVLHVAVFDKQLLPLPSNLTAGLSLPRFSNERISELKASLIKMRDELCAIISSLEAAEKKQLLVPLEDEPNVKDKDSNANKAEEVKDQPQYKTLSTSDMAGFLDSNHRKKSSQDNVVQHVDNVPVATQSVAKQATRMPQQAPDDRRGSSSLYPQPLPANGANQYQNAPSVYQGPPPPTYPSHYYPATQSAITSQPLQPQYQQLPTPQTTQSQSLPGLSAPSLANLPPSLNYASRPPSQHQQYGKQ